MNHHFKIYKGKRQSTGFHFKYYIIGIEMNFDVETENKKTKISFNDYQSLDYEKVKYGSNGEIVKGTDEYDDMRKRNNKAIRLNRENKKEVRRIEKEISKASNTEKVMLQEKEKLIEEIKILENQLQI